MRQSASAALRSPVASLLAISLFALSLAAFAPAHLHGGVKSDACAVCKASEIPIISTRAAIAVRDPLPVAEHIHLAVFEAPADLYASAKQSRGPPAI
jgi:hypothetical protein